MADADVRAHISSSRPVDFIPSTPRSRPGHEDAAPRSSFQETLQQINTEQRAHSVATPQQQQQQHQKQQKRFFAWLPAHGMSSDLVYGSWWFIFGSIFSALIPLVPLVSLYVGWWPDTSTFLPLDIHVTAYVLLIVVGVFFTVGSYAFLRAVHPRLKDIPLFNKDYERKENLGLLQRQCMTDELFGMW